jgi:signal transduction histidine kinase
MTVQTLSGSKYELEPGLLRAFRLLMLLPLTVMLPMPILLWFGRSFGIERLVQTPVSAFQAVLPISIAVTCIYLYAPWFQEHLGHWFLPTAIALCTIGPMWVLLNELRYPWDARMPDAIGVIWAAPLFLMIPITIIVWQYDFRRLVFYCLVLAGIELGYNLILGAPDTLHGWNLLQYSVARIVIFLAIGYLISRMVEAQRQQRTALAHANQQLRQYATTLEQLTISRERNRMAHELHDTMAHTMSGMILQLEGAQLMWDSDNTRARQSLDEAIGTTRQGLNETRRALKALRARPVEENGIVEAIRQLATASAKRSNLTLDLHVPAQPLLLTPVLEQTVYRIAQEALTNIERHAQATAISLALSAEHGQLRLMVRDNGCGFALDAAEKSDRLGLRGMRERADLVDGQLKVASAPGQGTMLEFWARQGDGMAEQPS